MLAGLAIFNTVIGDISLGYGSAMTMVVGLFIALCLGGLYLVVVRPRPTRAVPADADGRLDVPAVRMGIDRLVSGCGASPAGPEANRASPAPRTVARAGSEARSGPSCPPPRPCSSSCGSPDRSRGSPSRARSRCRPSPRCLHS